MEYTNEEISKLEEFRLRVNGILTRKFHHEDAFLITWLRARQLNLDKAEEMLRNSLEWRRKNKVDEIIKNLERENIPEKYMAATPFAYCGFDDKSHCPVFLYLMGKHDVRSMIEAEGLERVTRFNIIGMEMMIEIMKDLGKKKGKPVTQIIEIIDFEGYSYKQISSKICRDAMAATQSIMDLNYPEILRHITVINAPKIFYLLFNFMKPMIPKETLAKIEIFGTDDGKWKEYLRSKYPMDLIPKHWGGTLEGSDEYCSDSSIWIYGRPPLSFFTKVDEDGFIQAKVSARDKFQTTFDVIEPGCSLEWKFKVEKYDIDFSVLYEKEQVVPARRIRAKSIMQEGLIQCSKLGKYVVVFDNSYSYTRSKIVHYKIDMRSNYIYK